VILRIAHIHNISNLQKPIDFCNIIQRLCSLARLSDLQQRLIFAISRTNLNTTQFVSSFSAEKSIPKSTVWHNTRKLRDRGIVLFDSKITLTQLGVILSSGSSMVEQVAVARKVGGSNPSHWTCRKAGGNTNE
jgi:hypothetical protein